MKIAVVIAGQPRSYDKAYQYLKRNLLDRYDCDIFYHSWINPIVSEHEIDSLYKPKARLTETKPPLDVWNARYTNTPNAISFPAANAAASFKSLFKANMLRIDYQADKGVRYDWVVRTRFDYALNVALDFEDLESKKWNRMLFIPSCRMVSTHDFGNDQFAFGKPDVITQYCSTYMHMDDFYNQGVQMNGEAMMQATIRLYGLTGNRLSYVDMKNPFPPGPYNGTTHSLIRDDYELWKNV